MSDVVATKTDSEREDDEANRLVRKAPKLKPPRHDRRRETVRVDVEDDPDLKKRASRVALRFIKSKRVPAVNKETGDTVLVAPETLQHSSKYEAVEPEDEPNGQDVMQPQGPAPKGSNPKANPDPKSPKEKPVGRKAPEKVQKAPANEEGESPTVADKMGIEAPTRKAVSVSERQETTILLADHLPPKLAAKLIAEDIHPEDARILVGSYNAMSAKRVGDVAEYAEKVAGFFETDIDLVQPPKSWKTTAGETVPFESLPQKEKAGAYRQHQMQVVAASLAAQERLQEKLSTTTPAGVPTVPKNMAAALSRSLLQGPKKARILKSVQGKLTRLKESGASSEDIQHVQDKLSDLERQASEQAVNVFEKIATTGTHVKIPLGSARRLLASVEKSPETQQLARAYLEANDYKRAKSEYLKAGSLSENSPVGEIVNQLKDSREFFSKQSQDYGGHPHEGGRYFEARVLGKLKELAPEKYEKVQATLAKVDTKVYETAKKAYEKARKKWSSMPEDQRGPEPQAPQEPVSYLSSKDPKTLRSEANRLMKDLGERSKSTKIATTVSGRYLISTYPRGKTMAHESSEFKVALYHGIDPQENYPAGPYRGWGQAHQRDLDESDYSVILDSAKTWMKSPVLTEGTLDMVPDQKYRHALDLAIQASIYNRAIDVPTYNKLLARLQGVPEPGLTQPGLPTKHAADRKTTERAIYRSFPSDSKMKRGGKLIVMLTGESARKLKRSDYVPVALEDLSEKDLGALVDVMKVRTASESHTHATEALKVTFEGEGLITPDLSTDLETSDFFFQDENGDTHDDGSIGVVSATGKSLTLVIPKGSKSESLQAIENIAKKYKLTAKVASSSINNHKGSSLNSRCSAWANNLPVRGDGDQQERVMKLSSDQKQAVNTTLARIDRIAGDIQAKAQEWGMPFEYAKAIVNGLDKTADEVEKLAFGEESLGNRQLELAVSDPALSKAAAEEIGEETLAKAAKVLQRDSDESYMDTFNSPTQPHETDADEPYMSAYSDDQSEAVGEGKEENGQDVAPHY